MPSRFSSSRVATPDLDVVAVTDEGLGNTGWVVRVGDEALVVDAERDPDPYLRAADELGAPVAIAADTHLHADFLTGSRALEQRGARSVVAAAGEYRWGHHHLHAREELDLGGWRVRALPTPGHTPEHLAYLLTERRHPKAVFTGGSLLVGSVARTDLSDPGSTEDLTRRLWRSINRELLSLPDDVVVFPTHGAGSFCSAAGGARRWTTIGDERRTNPLLQAPSEDEFVKAVLAGLGSFPPYFLRLRERNRLGRHVERAVPWLPRLDAATVRAWQERGAIVVDVRPVAEYAAGHIPGSLANTLRPQFASWLGWLVHDPDAPLVFVVDEHIDRADLTAQCLNVGYENLVGEVTVADWVADGGDLSSTTTVAASDVGDADVVDVRQAAEFADGHVPGATHIELGSLAEHADRVGSGPVVVMCGHGERAATAASILEALGGAEVRVMVGGPGEWADAHGQRLADG